MTIKMVSLYRPINDYVWDFICISIEIQAPESKRYIWTHNARGLYDNIIEQYLCHLLYLKICLKSGVLERQMELN